MALLDTVAVLVTLAALLSYVNHRWVRLPTAVGLLGIALLLSLAVVAAGRLGMAAVTGAAAAFIAGIDFHETLMQGMLSVLLFAGALHVDLGELSRQKGIVAVLATFGVVATTFLVGAAAWWVFGLLGLAVPFVYCLVFGALIAPTDPIAVLGVLKQAGVPRSVEIKITGESLFNDGIGVVVFLVLAGLAAEGGAPEPAGVAWLLVQEAAGGALLGLLLGGACYALLRGIDNYQVEILLTLALVLGGYALAGTLHVSGPIAMVVAGLLLGNHGRLLAMSPVTREHLDGFWELMDEFFNAVLFVLIGLEVLVLSFSLDHLWAALFLVPVVLGARWLSVAVPVSLLRRFRPFTPGVVALMTWGGIRGGISVALALSLPAGPVREVLVGVTYGIVVFSILVQGLTLGPLARRLAAR